MDDTGAYKIEVSNESGSASGAFKMKVVSKCCSILYSCLVIIILLFSLPEQRCTAPDINVYKCLSFGVKFYMQTL